MRKLHLSQSSVSELLEYNPTTGDFTWKRSRSGVRRRLAGNAPNKGNSYRRIQVLGVLEYAHRLAFLLMTGRIPDYVDHIDGDRTNCRWENLREVSSRQNAQNNNRRGYYQNPKGRFVAQITINYRSFHIGTYNTAQEARDAYEAAKKQHHLSWARKCEPNLNP